MSRAHLHAVPDPDDEPSPGPGEWPAPAPVPAVVAPHPPADDEDQKQPLTADVNEDLTDAAAEQPRGLARLRPYRTDLRPYLDPRPLAELVPLAVQVGKHSGPPLFRAIWAGLRLLGRGTGVLLGLLTGYLSGTIGKRGSTGTRFCAAGFATYAAVKLSTQCPPLPWFLLAALLAVVVLAGLGRIKMPESEPAKGAAKKTTKREKSKKGTPAGKASAEGDVGEPDQTPTEEAEQVAPASPRKGLLGRLRRRSDSPAENNEEDSPEAVAENTDEAPAEPPRDPSREVLAGALHHLYRGGSGVLHTALVQHLGLADTRAAKRALDEAGIPYRTGVRTPAGNGPGVHRSDFPPLSPASGSPQGTDVVAGQPANTNANNTANTPGKGSAVEGNVWTAEELAQGYRWVQDPAKPCAWQIEHLTKN